MAGPLGRDGAKAWGLWTKGQRATIEASSSLMDVLDDLSLAIANALLNLGASWPEFVRPREHDAELVVGAPTPGSGALGNRKGERTAMGTLLACSHPVNFDPSAHPPSSLGGA